MIKTNYMKLKSYLLVAVSVLAFVGCKKDYLDVNTNPNQLTSATPSFVLTGALNTTTQNLVLANETGSYFAGQWTQSNSYILSATTFSYNITNNDFNYWDGMYDNAQDYQYVINNADASGQPYFKGPAKIMKAMLFQYIVDMYGNAPYTEAFKGTAALAPAFDDQKAIYANLVTLLDQAIADIKGSTFDPAYASSDVVFKGNATNWIKLANSMKLRILMHQSRVPSLQSYVKTELNKIAADATGVLTTDAGVNPGYIATDGKTNPLYNRFGYTPAGAAQSYGRFPRVTKNLFDQMVATADTFRIKRLLYAVGGENGSTPGVSVKTEIIANYKAVPYGVSSGFTAPSTSNLGPAIIVKGKFDAPYILFTATEAQFLLAEAKQRFGAEVNFTGTAQSYYEAGVKASFKLVGSTDAAATALLTSGNQDADFTASTDKLKAIATQKWIALTHYAGLESWTEYRRTNLPVIPQMNTVTDPNKRPLRFFYPGTEFGSNGANVTAQGAIDIFATKLFWDID